LIGNMSIRKPSTNGVNICAAPIFRTDDG
jgi:hypothetical protein